MTVGPAVGNWRPVLAVLAVLGALLLLAVQGTSLARAQTFQIDQSTPARAAILIDLSSGAVLLEKNADVALPPASMSKLMTLEVVFEALEAGTLSLTDEFRTSARASKMGGSRMFIREGGLVSVENLVRGVVVHSGNDAAVALAEALSGTEEAFAEFTTQRGRELGLTNSVFINSTGWPHPDHVMSVRDLATLAIRIVTRFPKLYEYFLEEEFTWAGIRQKNRNPLLGLGIGADGLKTGHTEEAGYGLVASAIRGDRRVVLVVTGLESARQRRQEAERLINWAYRAFETRTIYRAGEPLVQAPVWIGAERHVELAPKSDVVLTVPVGLDRLPLPQATYRTPVEAPLAAGQAVGEITVSAEGMPTVQVPLVTVAAVERGGFVARMEAAARLALKRLIALSEG